MDAMNSSLAADPSGPRLSRPIRVRRISAHVQTLSARARLWLICAGFAVLRRTVRTGYQTGVRFLGRLFRGSARVEVEIEGGVRLSVRLNDPYWISILFAGDEYEPELGVVLNGLLGPRSAFVDCGANIGVWSCVAAGLIGDPKRVIAVEPGRPAVDELRRNAALSPIGFQVVEAAVWKESDASLSFLERRAHTDSSLAGIAAPSSEPTVSRRQVSTVSLDDLLTQVNQDVDVIVLKIDLEGADVPCLEAATLLSGRPLIIVYEDHGSDAEHRVSSWFATHGFSIFGPSAEAGRLTPVSLQEIARRKVLKFSGYNFVAVRSGREHLLVPILAPC